MTSVTMKLIGLYAGTRAVNAIEKLQTVSTVYPMTMELLRPQTLIVCP